MEEEIPFTAREDITIMHVGTKTFWKTRTYLKIHMINHFNLSCLEIICSDPATATEFPRFYLDTDQLRSKLDPEIVNSKFVEKKEALLRQKKAVNNIEIVEQVTSEMMRQYVYVRIHIPANLPAGVIQVTLLPSNDDTIAGSPRSPRQKLDVECPKPANLIPYNSVLDSLEAETSAKEDCKTMYNLLHKDKDDRIEMSLKTSQLLVTVVDAFKHAVRRRAQLSTLGLANVGHSAARRRWILATHKMVIRNTVRKMRARVAQLAARKLVQQYQPVLGVMAVEGVDSPPRSRGSRTSGGSFGGSFDDSNILENYSLPWSTVTKNEEAAHGEMNPRYAPFTDSKKKLPPIRRPTSSINLHKIALSIPNFAPPAPAEQNGYFDAFERMQMRNTGTPSQHGSNHSLSEMIPGHLKPLSLDTSALTTGLERSRSASHANHLSSNSKHALQPSALKVSPTSVSDLAAEQYSFSMSGIADMLRDEHRHSLSSPSHHSPQGQQKSSNTAVMSESTWNSRFGCAPLPPRRQTSNSSLTSMTSLSERNSLEWGDYTGEKTSHAGHFHGLKLVHHHNAALNGGRLPKGPIITPRPSTADFLREGSGRASRAGYELDSLPSISGNKKM